MSTIMSSTSILAALSLLATGSVVFAGCDKDTPATEVPGAARTSDVDDAEPEPSDEAAQSPDPGPQNVPSSPELTAIEEPLAPGTPDQDTVAQAAIPEPEAGDNAAPPPPKARPKPRSKPKKRRSRARASKGEAACGEGTCA